MRNRPIWRLIFVAAVTLCMAATTGLAAPPSHMAHAPSAEEVPGIDGATEVEMQRRFNELRREVLDDRAAAIGWWLSGVALLLTVLAVVVAAGGYVGLRKIQEIAAEARQNVERAGAHAEEARTLVDEMRQYEGDAGEALREMCSAGSGSALAITGGDTTRDPGRVGASAIAEARQLAEDGRIDEAIERWRQIANVAAGTNDDLAALAHRSVGDLSEQKSRSPGR